MSLHHAMHPRLPNHGNQVSNLQHPDKDPLINRVEAFSNGVFAIAITLPALGLTVPHVIGEVWVNHHGCLATSTGQPTGSYWATWEPAPRGSCKRNLRAG